MGVYDLNRISVPVAPSGYRDDTADSHYVPAPCQVACPVGTDAPSYIAYIWEGRLEEAYEAITDTNPFSSICGRVCDAPCEPACRRTSSDGPLQIRNLKRFVMDQVGHRYDPPAAPVTESQSVGIVGAGPAGLTAAQDLCLAGYRVEVYEMTDRLGGMMVWGIPAFRLPPGTIEEDITRLKARCPGLSVHLNTALGRDVGLDELKQRHDAVLLTIGSWWGKPMGVPGDDHPGVVDGAGFLRRVNSGERPTLPETVIVVGGGDVAMDACRVARRLPGCKNVKVIYRRGPEEIPAREIELHHALKEGVEVVYNTLQLEVVTGRGGLTLRCVRTEMGEPGADGRRRPVPVAGSEHDIECGMLIAAVGQQGACDDLEARGMMLPDRVRADFESMRTDDPQVFAAGDGAFGGSTIVMAMHHGQRAAYYLKAHLRGIAQPMPYRTPYRTRRVPVAQDLLWEKLPLHEPEFHGLGDNPAAFPEIERSYDADTARQEAARCYRCDAETGSADYSVTHREDIFSMARINPVDHAKNKAMLDRRLSLRDNPFPEGRPASLDDVVFLPANLSRLVIDPYREACEIGTEIGAKLILPQPFIVTGFDAAPAEVRRSVGPGLTEIRCPYLGVGPIDEGAPWLQLVGAEGPDPRAVGWIYTIADRPVMSGNDPGDRLVGIVVADPEGVAGALELALETECDLLLLDATGALGSAWPELVGAPDFSLLRRAIDTLRALRREEHIDLVYFGGTRSGTDAAKLIGLGAKAVVYGVPAALAAGGQIRGAAIEFSADRGARERADAVVNLLRANASEASMMARCTGKTRLHNLEPEDLRAVTLATAAATGVPLVGHRQNS